MQFSKTFDLKEPIRLPAPILMRSCSDGSTLAICPSMPCWIVLRDDMEGQALGLLREGHSLGRVQEEMKSRQGDSGVAALRRLLTEISVQGFFPDATPLRAGSACNMTLYLTNRCNLSCKHCYRFQEQPGSELTRGEWERTLEAFSKLPDCGGFVTVSGGEATTRKDLVDILWHSARIGLKNVLLTNGTRINASLATALAATCFEVQVSIDGCNAETNDPIRGGGSFSSIMSGLAALADARSKSGHRARIAIAVTALPQYLDQLEERLPSFFGHLNDMFDGGLLLRMTTSLKPGREFPGLSSGEQEAYEMRTRRLKELVRKDPDWNDKIDGERFAPNVRVVNCGFGQNISVQPDGKVFGCYDAKDEFIGNVLNSTLKDIRAGLKALCDATLVNLSTECSKCDLMYLCGGGCRLHNKQFRGEYLLPHCCQADKDWKQKIYDLMARKRKWSWCE